MSKTTGAQGRSKQWTVEAKVTHCFQNFQVCFAKTNKELDSDSDSHSFSSSEPTDLRKGACCGTNTIYGHSDPSCKGSVGRDPKVKSDPHPLYVKTHSRPWTTC